MPLDPFFTFREFIIVPSPVWRPQPRGTRTGRSSAFETLTRLRSVATAWAAKEDWPKWPFAFIGSVAVHAGEAEVQLPEVLAAGGLALSAFFGA